MDTLNEDALESLKQDTQELVSIVESLLEGNVSNQVRVRLCINGQYYLRHMKAPLANMKALFKNTLNHLVQPDEPNEPITMPQVDNDTKESKVEATESEEEPAQAVTDGATKRERRLQKYSHRGRRLARRESQLHTPWPCGALL